MKIIIPEEIALIIMEMLQTVMQNLYARFQECIQKSENYLTYIIFRTLNFSVSNFELYITFTTINIENNFIERF